MADFPTGIFLLKKTVDEFPESSISPVGATGLRTHGAT